LTSETTGDAPKPILRDDPEQSNLFIKKAREIGVDGQDSSADTVLGQLHKKPPAPHSTKSRLPEGDIRD
jgi:hypothetical protein